MGREWQTKSELNRIGRMLFHFPLPSWGRFVPRCRQSPAANPDLTPAKIAAARAALAAWKQTDGDEGKAEETQSTLIGQLQAKVDAINTARHDIQLAADTCWPASDKANAPIRRSFKIPVDKPIAK